MRFIKFNKRTKKIKVSKNYLKSIGEYINLIKRKKLKTVYYNYEIKNPKISFIITVFNKDKYLDSLILSIQHQNIKEFEIIFIDDCSTDKSVNIINYFSKFDRRIKLIKNKNNRGALYSRSQGALKSKGEYIIFVDSDDIILKEGIYNSYKYIKKNKLSMIQFNTIFQINDSLSLISRYYKYEKIIKQPILSYIFYYNEKTKKARELNTALWDKLIKQEIVIKALNFIGEDFYKENIKIENDIILLFSLFRMADSYQYINETGYIYIRNHNDSITNNWQFRKNWRAVIHGVFVNINFFFIKTGNSFFDKSYCVFKLLQSFERYKICYSEAKSEFTLIQKVLKKLLSSPYISRSDKKSIYMIFDNNIMKF